jgi:microcystin-dependent protein
MPVGAIIMWWSNNPAPAGWHVCDGTAGTPDLRSKFILAAGSGITLGQQGGQFSYTGSTYTQGAHDHGPTTGNTALTVAQMPNHNHIEYVMMGGGGSGNGPAANTTGTAFAASGTGTANVGGDQPHNHTIAVAGNHAHNVDVNSTPPFVGVWYIMRIS